MGGKKNGKWVAGKWEAKIKMSIYAKPTCAQMCGHVCLCVCGDGVSMCVKKPAGELRWASLLQAIGSTSSAPKIYRQRGPYQTVSSMFPHLIRSLHLCIVMRLSRKRYFLKACSEALQGSAVTGVTFFAAGRGFSGFSCFAGVRAVVLFKRCLMPCCPPHIASWLFCLFSPRTLTDWLTDTSVYWLSSV